jgi:hypothetical protein
VLANIRKDEVGGDGRHLVEPRLAEFALHVVLGCETEAAVGLQTDVGGFPGGVGCEQLSHVGFGAAGLAGVEERRRFVAHEICGAQVGVGAGDRELDALVLPDGAVENDALAGVAPRAIDEPETVADAFGGDEDAFGVHAIEDVAEALALFADEGLGGNLEVIEEDFVGLVVDHVADGAQREAGGPLAQVDQEHRKPFGLFRDFGERRGARQEEHQVGMLDTRNPHLLTIDDVAVAAPVGEGADFGGVGTGGGFGHGEGLQPQLARRDLRKVALFLLRRSVPQQRAHDVHLGVAGA